MPGSPYCEAHHPRCYHAIPVYRAEPQLIPVPASVEREKADAA
jgi:hypothetical protein